MNILYKKTIITCLFAFISLNLLAQTYIVGTGIGTNTGSGAATDYPGPFNDFWGSERTQMLVKASELTGLGASAGVIKSLALNVAAVNTPNDALTMTVSIGTTALNSLTGYVAGLTTVYSGTYTPSGGWNTFNFNSCFTWNGTSNIVVEVCFSDASGSFASTGASTYWTTGLAFNASVYTGSAGGCGTTSATTSTSRPNLQFNIVPPIMDAAITAISSPGTFVTLGSGYPVTMTLKNNACSGNLTSATVGYAATAATTATIAWTGSLAPGTSTTVTVTPSYTVSKSGFISFKGFVSNANGLASDADITNDTLQIPMVSINPSAPANAYEGTDFWTTFAQSLGTTAPVEPTNKFLFITSSHNAIANVSIPTLGYTNNGISIPANTVVKVTIPSGSNYYCKTANAANNAGINITSNLPISVYGLSQTGASTDGWLCIPTPNLGTDYITMAPTGSSDGATSNPSTFMIIATQTGTTTATIKLPATKAATGHTTLGSSWSVNLTQGQVYYATSNGIAADQYDLTGVQITSNQNVAVLGGAICGSYPETGNTGGYATCTPCDHMMEQMTPTSSWGTSFVAAPYYDASNNIMPKASYLRVVTYDPGTTTINITGFAPQTLTGKGAYKDFQITAGAVVTSNKGIALYEIMASAGCYTTNGDADLVSIIPEQQWGQYYPFITGDPSPGYFQDFIIIVTKGNTNKIYFDGNVQNGYIAIGATGYYYVPLYISGGAHAVIGDHSFMVYVYGVASVESYSYPASGANLVPILLPVNLLSFKANLDKGAVQLNWSTASEQNSNYFDVERSTDGTSFTKIGESVRAAGNSNTLRKYTTVDSHPSSGLNYYRLKQVDLNGKEDYSYITSVDVSRIIFNISVNPQPTTHLADVSFTATESCIANVALYDITGRKLMQLPEQNLREGVNNLNVDISSFSKGIYFLNLTSSNGLQENIKLVKE